MTKHTILTKESKNEIIVFAKKFNGHSYTMESDGVNITKIETNDKEIIAYAKELGLTVGE